ncbi:MAG TPA: APC family permease, partial [Terriglobia bacterium]|nr:APC family permease [Terriglobia bacterium]
PFKGSEIPLGLGIITTLLFSVAGINLIKKQVATVSGVAFTLVFFVIFLTSEHYNRRQRGSAAHVELDEFKTHLEESVNLETVGVRAGNTLCLVRDYNTLEHVRKALELTHTGKKDLVVMTVHLHRGPDVGYRDLREEDVFTDYEQLLFSRVVALAEKAGKHVRLLVVPSSDIFQAIVQTAARLGSSEIIAGRSSVMAAEQQAQLMGQAWEKLPNRPKHQVCFRVIDADGKVRDFYLGAHEPRLTQEEVEFIHELWLELTRDGGAEEIHHRDIVTLALTRLGRELHGRNREQVLEEIHGEIKQGV